LFITSTALADTWTVDDDGKADFDNIQAAVDAASDGDEIIVMPGTYTGTGDQVVDMKGKAVRLHSNNVLLMPIIDGEGARRGILCNSGETNKTIIEGFTITFGYAINGGGMHNDTSSPTLTNCTFDSNSALTYGGGMVNNNYSSPTLTNCSFTNNTSDHYGGGMRNYNNSNPTLENCAFENNTATNGSGGMYNHTNSNPTLTNCTFTGNTAGVWCGGMYNSESSPTLTNCTFTDNTANYGSGMYNWESSPTLTSCTFENNTANDDGGGMYNRYSSPTLENCLFTNNTATTYGGGMFNDNIYNPTLTDTTVCGNTPDQIYGDWNDNGGNTIVDGDINGDGFVDVSDLLVIIDQWGLTNSPADINQDGIVDVSDLLIVVGNWGPCE